MSLLLAVGTARFSRSAVIPMSGQRYFRKASDGCFCVEFPLSRESDNSGESDHFDLVLMRQKQGAPDSEMGSAILSEQCRTRESSTAYSPYREGLPRCPIFQSPYNLLTDRMHGTSHSSVADRLLSDWLRHPSPATSSVVVDRWEPNSCEVSTRPTDTSLCGDESDFC